MTNNFTNPRLINISGFKDQKLYPASVCKRCKKLVISNAFKNMHLCKFFVPRLLKTEYCNSHLANKTGTLGFINKERVNNDK